MLKRDNNGSSESERLLLEHGRTRQESGSNSEASAMEKDGIEGITSGIYTGDGSVGINGNPVLKQNTGNWKACSFILGSECCERLAYYGIATNLVTYLTRKLHQGNVSAAKNVSIWQGTCYLTPLIGAALADAYLGRYWTIALSTMVYFLGLVVLTLSATIPGLRPSECTNSHCPKSTIAQSAVFLSGLYMIALGTGGIKPCVSPFGADQFDATDPKESVKKASFFNWYYFTICVGIIVSSVFLVWIQDNIGWGLGFAIPALFMAMATAVFLSGTPFYRIQRPKGSPFTRICQVLVASYRKRNLEVPADKSLLYETQDKSGATEPSSRLDHINTFKFLDKAAVISEAEIMSGDSSDRWKLCTKTQVEELKSLLRLIPIWATGIPFYVVLGQVPIFVEQGMTMDTTISDPLSISAATFSSIDAVFVMLLIPVYDRLVVPALKRITGNEKGVSVLQRIGAGLFFSVLCLVASAALETHRLRVAGEGGGRVSIFWQTPQYFLMSVSEMLAYVGQMELLYEEAPVAMRSLCSALVFLSLSVGFYLSSFLLTVVAYFTSGGGWIPDDLNEGHLDRYFWLLACLCFFNLLLFVLCAKNFKQTRAS